MKFSIVTVTLNAADDLPLTIESIIQQSFTDYEYIVVDGGSFDQTADILDTYSQHISRVVRLEDAGIFSAMNDALEFCNGEFVIFLNAKDRFYSADVLEKIAEAMAPSADIVFGDHIYVNGRKHYLHKAARFDLNFDRLERGEVDHRWHSRIPCHQATFTRTSLLRKLSYDTRLEICADHDFMFRAFAGGATFQYVDEVVCHYMAGGFSALRSERLRQEFASTYRKFSTQPLAVDRLFYGDDPTPFSPYTPKTGYPSAGLASWEGPYPDSGVPNRIAWCGVQGFELTSPSDIPTIACSVDLYSIFPDQTVTITHGEQVLGQISVPMGYGRFRIDFLSPVPARSQIRFSASQRGTLSPKDGRFVSLALGPISFQGLPSFGLGKSFDAPFDVGVYEVIDLGADFRPKFLPSGWSTVCNDHIWSVGLASTIVTSVADSVSEICLHLVGHPYLSPEIRGVNIRVNGSQQKLFILDVTPQIINLKLPAQASSSAGNIIIVKLEPLSTGNAPGDDRDLGVCLLGIELK